ncbi:MAG: OmpA family protein [Gammaproteobacteria bacterium]
MLPHLGTGVNLVVTSRAQPRCAFEGSGDSEQWYLGETGLEPGRGLKFGGQETPDYAGSNYCSERAIAAPSADAASAPFAYDCWLFATARGPGDRQASCQSRFETAVNAIETAVAEEDLGAMVMCPMGQRVLFDTDVRELGGKETIVFNAIKQRLRFLSGASIHVMGNADQPGTREYKLEVSERRAQAVRAALVQAGIPSTGISSEAFGEENTLPDNRYDALNRRVDMVVKPPALNEAAVREEVARRRDR